MGVALDQSPSRDHSSIIADAVIDSASENGPTADLENAANTESLDEKTAKTDSAGSAGSEVAATASGDGKLKDVPSKLSKEVARDNDLMSEEEEIEEHPNKVTEDTEDGVKKAEAVALVWSKKAVYCAYAWIWVCYFVLSLQQSITSNLLNYAYSTFNAAPQINTATVVGGIVGGVLKLPIAKILNIWGRTEGLVVFVGVYVLGIIIIASCNGPNSYAAGYVFYWVGYDAVYMILSIFIADTAGLKNRAFAFGFSTTPFICTAFTGPLAAQSFLEHSSWRWGNGAFAIIMPCVFAPLAIMFKYYQRKAEKLGVLKKTSHGSNRWESFKYYYNQFDVIGTLILLAAFVLFLLPFSLTTNGRMVYKSAGFIVMVILGVLLFPVFYLWERHVKVPFMRWQLLRKPTVLGAITLMCLLYFSFYCWDTYFYQFVLVVYNLNLRDTGYMLQIYNVGSCFWSPVFGILIRWTKHFKYLTLAGLCLLILGSGLMIHFRGDDQPIGLLIMSQIFVAFGGGSVVIGCEMAVMAAADRDGVPMMLSIIGMCSSVGGAMGAAVAGTIFSGDFVKALTRALPAGSKSLASTLATGGYLVQIKYLPGTAIRNAINYAWGHTQKLGCIASTCILAAGIPCILVWKNYNVDRKQNKGQVL